MVLDKVNSWSPSGKNIKPLDPLLILQLPALMIKIQTDHRVI